MDIRTGKRSVYRSTRNFPRLTRPNEEAFSRHLPPPVVLSLPPPRLFFDPKESWKFQANDVAKPLQVEAHKAQHDANNIGEVSQNQSRHEENKVTNTTKRPKKSLREGIFVSRKRLYKEFVFDSYDESNNPAISGTGGPRSRRRGPLAPSSRDNIEKVKTGGGACWRCEMLKKSASMLTFFLSARSYAYFPYMGSVMERYLASYA
jgi:hypothetical protein